MAQLLQQLYSLPVIRIQLLTHVRDPTAQLELVINVDGRQVVYASDACTLEELGFPATWSRGDPRLQVPDRIVDWLSITVADSVAENPPPAFWIHLVKPYGLLGAVPWELCLQPALRVPLLRLPDMLPGSERPNLTYDVALCATSPRKDELSSTAKLIPQVARAMQLGIGKSLRLHIFCEASAHPWLAPELDGLRFELYARDGREGPSRSVLQNLWLDWIRSAAAGRTLDAVHFIAHGCALGVDGAMLTTISPETESRDIAQVVQAGALRTFLTQIGAVAATFTAPHDNSSPYGLRKLVDDLGALRAGPVALHDASAADAMKVLAGTYRLLSADGAGVPPADPSLMLFAQPRQIIGVRPEDAPPEPATDELGASKAVHAYLAREDAPQWISTAERFMSENEADLVRFRDNATRNPPTPAQEAHYAGVEAALKKVRAVIDRHAEAQL